MAMLNNQMVSIPLPLSSGCGKCTICGFEKGNSTSKVEFRRQPFAKQSVGKCSVEGIFNTTLGLRRFQYGEVFIGALHHIFVATPNH